MRKEQLKIWLRAIRAPGFFTVSVTPVLLATAMAWYDGFFSLKCFILTLIGSVAVHCGATTSNEYYDYLSGNDVINQVITPFSGGTRVIVDGVLPAKSILRAAILFFSTGILIGLYFYTQRGMTVLLFGLAGVLIAYFYTAPPVKLAYRGWGELVLGIAFGPLIVAGAYYLQTGELGLRVITASIPIGLLTTAILYINEFPDYEADKEAAKLNLVVRLGTARAVPGYFLLMAVNYTIIAAAALTGLFPLWSLLVFLTLPAVFWAAKRLFRYHNDYQRLIPANAVTIAVHFMSGLLLTFAWIADRVL